jgi:hypothetical protein
MKDAAGSLPFRRWVKDMNAARLYTAGGPHVLVHEDVDDPTGRMTS